MTIKAWTPTGIRIIDITPPTARTTYDGVHIRINGTARIDGAWANAGISIDMNPNDALDFAISLVDAVRQNQKQNESRLKQFSKMIDRRMKK
jgi:hypothetical protein